MKKKDYFLRKQIDELLNFEDKYEDFEIIIYKNEIVPDCYDAVKIDWHYNEGQDDSILDGWCFLSDLLSNAYKKGYFNL